MKIGRKMMYPYLLPIEKYSESWFSNKFPTDSPRRRLYPHLFLLLLTLQLRKTFTFPPFFYKSYSFFSLVVSPDGKEAVTHGGDSSIHMSWNLGSRPALPFPVCGVWGRITIIITICSIISIVLSYKTLGYDSLTLPAKISFGLTPENIFL